MPTDYDLNYEVLREEGLKFIEALGSRLWTDYNTHDPGITILEMLCYAISDLGYRTAFPIQNLLADDPARQPDTNEGQLFFTAKQILASCPVTEADYRKLLLQIEGVKNAWVERVDGPEAFLNKGKGSSGRHYFLGYAPGEQVVGEPFRLKGFYHILIEPEPLLTEPEREALPPKVERMFHLTRNLCETLAGEVTVAPSQDITVCAELELHSEASAEEVHAQILFDLQEYLTPAARYYSLQELLASGKGAEEIFEGPVALELLPQQASELASLDNGFLEEPQLKKSALGREAHTSDLLQTIMKVKGVKTVRKFLVRLCNTTNEETEEPNWVLKIPEGHQARLCLDHSVFRCYKDVIPIETDKAAVLSLLDDKYAEQKSALESKSTDGLPIPTGQFMDVGHYDTFQNQFPDNYGINRSGLPGHASDERQAYAKQLKAYLLFFDQILANYFAQLANAKELFKADDSIQKTYFSQLPKGLREMEALYFHPERAAEELDT
ncbi:MAG: hypothetical protein KDD06_30020, partial [Phaeodactylibacter sp.]|nr:hypothetical protein [Phaeodactylibacter sp.]